MQNLVFYKDLSFREFVVLIFLLVLVLVIGIFPNLILDYFYGITCLIFLEY